MMVLFVVIAMVVPKSSTGEVLTFIATTFEYRLPLLMPICGSWPHLETPS